MERDQFFVFPGEYSSPVSVYVRLRVLFVVYNFISSGSKFVLSFKYASMLEVKRKMLSSVFRMFSRSFVRISVADKGRRPYSHGSIHASIVSAVDISCFSLPSSSMTFMALILVLRGQGRSPERSLILYHTNDPSFLPLLYPPMTSSPLRGFATDWLPESSDHDRDGDRLSFNARSMNS